MVIAKSKSKFVHASQYKLRPYADVIRGHDVEKALAWLKSVSLKRLVPLQKTIVSALSNAKNKNQSLEANGLVISKICIDGGPVFKSHKPAAMGRAAPQLRRTCHIEVELSKREG